MDPEGFATLAAMLKDLGLFGALLLVLVGGSRKMWVWGWQHTEILKQERAHAEREISRLESRLSVVEDERDYYRDALMRALNVSEAFVGGRAR